MQRANFTANGARKSKVAFDAQSNKRRRTDLGDGLSPLARTNSGFSNSQSETPSGQTPQRSNQVAREGEETAWVLKSVVSPAAAHTDEESEEDIWSTKANGRQTFGKFTKRTARPTKPARDDADADLSSASEGEVSDDEYPPDHHNNVRRHAALKASARKTTEYSSPLRQFAEKQEMKKRKKDDHDQRERNRKKFRRTM